MERPDLHLTRPNGKSLGIIISWLKTLHLCLNLCEDSIRRFKIFPKKFNPPVRSLHESIPFNIRLQDYLFNVSVIETPITMQRRYFIDRDGRANRCGRERVEVVDSFLLREPLAIRRAFPQTSSPTWSIFQPNTQYVEMGLRPAWSSASSTVMFLSALETPCVSRLSGCFGGSCYRQCSTTILRFRLYRAPMLPMEPLGCELN